MLLTRVIEDALFNCSFRFEAHKISIIELYKKKELQHPTFQEIADKVLVSRQYVSQVIEKWKLEQKAMGKETE